MVVYIFDPFDTIAGYSEEDHGAGGFPQWTIDTGRARGLEGSPSAVRGSLFKSTTAINKKVDIICFLHMDDPPFGPNNDPGVGEVYFGDGTTYCGAGFWWSSEGIGLEISAKNNRDYAFAPSNRNRTSAFLSLSQIENGLWIKLSFDGTNDWTLQYNANGDSTTFPTSWIDAPNLGTYTQSMGSIVEYGLYCASNGGAFDHIWFWDNLYVIEFPDNPSEGFDESLEFDTIYTRSAMTGGGKARLVMNNSGLPVSFATINAQNKKEITLFNIYGTPIFRGEAGAFDGNQNNIVYEIEELLMKTRYTPVNVSPILVDNIIRGWVGGGLILDHEFDFLGAGVTTDHSVSLEQVDKFSFESPVLDASPYETILVSPPYNDYVEDYDNTSTNRLYYINPTDFSDDTVDINAHILMDENTTGLFFTRWYMVHYQTDVWEKFNNLTKMNKIEISGNISAIMRWNIYGGTRWPSHSANDFLILVFNHRRSIWFAVKGFGQSEMNANSVLDGFVYSGDGGSDEVLFLPVDFTFNVEESYSARAGTVDDWLIGTTYNILDEVWHDGNIWVSIQGANTGNTPEYGDWWRKWIYDLVTYTSTAGASDEFSEINIDIAIAPPYLDNSNQKVGLTTWKLTVKTTWDEPNEPEFSVGAITNVATNFIDTAAVGGTNLPNEQGFGMGTILKIVKSAEEYIENAWNASSLFTQIGPIDIDVTGIENHPVVEDYTFDMFYDLLQDVGAARNATYWYDYEIGSALMKSADVLISSGVVITAADIVGYDSDQWSYTINSTKERTSIVIIGDNGIIFPLPNTDGTLNLVAINPDHEPFGVGDEVEIIRDDSIKTLSQAEVRYNTEVLIRVHSEINIRFTLDYTNPVQSYFPLQVGRTLGVQIPSTSDPSIANYISGQDGELKIISMEKNENEEVGYNEHISVTLQRRWS